MVGISYSGYGGAAFPLWAEQFDTKVRTSGVAIGTQFGFALGGFAPAIAAALAGEGLRNWVPVAAFTSIAGVVAVIASLTMRENYQTPSSTTSERPAATTATCSRRGGYRSSKEIGDVPCREDVRPVADAAWWHAQWRS
jgi:hypothetical protein